MPTQKDMKECRDAYIDVKSNDSPYYKNKYQQISKRRGKSKKLSNFLLRKVIYSTHPSS